MVMLGDARDEVMSPEAFERSDEVDELLRYPTSLMLCTLNSSGKLPAVHVKRQGA